MFSSPIQIQGFPGHGIFFLVAAWSGLDDAPSMLTLSVLNTFSDVIEQLQCELITIVVVKLEVTADKGDTDALVNRRNSLIFRLKTTF